MKTKLSILVCAVLFAVHAFAQTPTTPQMPSSVSGATQSTTQSMPNGIGSILSTLGNGINPSSLTSAFTSQKSSWLSKAAALAPTDVKGSSGLLSQLVSGIKPSAFTSGFKTSDLLSKIKGASSMSDIGNSISSLVGGLNPSALTKDFAAN